MATFKENIGVRPLNGCVSPRTVEKDNQEKERSFDQLRVDFGVLPEILKFVFEQLDDSDYDEWFHYVKTNQEPIYWLTKCDLLYKKGFQDSPARDPQMVHLFEAYYSPIERVGFLRAYFVFEIPRQLGGNKWLRGRSFEDTITPLLLALPSQFPDKESWQRRPKTLIDTIIGFDPVRTRASRPLVPAQPKLEIEVEKIKSTPIYNRPVRRAPSKVRDQTQQHHAKHTGKSGMMSTTPINRLPDVEFVWLAGRRVVHVHRTGEKVYEDDVVSQEATLAEEAGVACTQKKFRRTGRHRDQRMSSMLLSAWWGAEQAERLKDTANVHAARKDARFAERLHQIRSGQVPDKTRDAVMKIIKRLREFEHVYEFRRKWNLADFRDVADLATFYTKYLTSVRERHDRSWMRRDIACARWVQGDGRSPWRVYFAKLGELSGVDVFVYAMKMHRMDRTTADQKKYYTRPQGLREEVLIALATFLATIFVTGNAATASVVSASQWLLRNGQSTAAEAARIATISAERGAGYVQQTIDDRIDRLLDELRQTREQAREAFEQKAEVLTEEIRQFKNRVQHDIGEASEAIQDAAGEIEEAVNRFNVTAESAANWCQSTRNFFARLKGTTFNFVYDIFVKIKNTVVDTIHAAANIEKEKIASLFGMLINFIVVTIFIYIAVRVLKFSYEFLRGMFSLWGDFVTLGPLKRLFKAADPVRPQSGKVTDGDFFDFFRRFMPDMPDRGTWQSFGESLPKFHRIGQAIEWFMERIPRYFAWLMSWWTSSPIPTNSVEKDALDMHQEIVELYSEGKGLGGLVSMMNASQEKRERCERVVLRYDCMVHRATPMEKRMSPIFIGVVHRDGGMVEEIRTALKRQAFERKTRPLPIWIHITGDNGVGKSRFITRLAARIKASVFAATGDERYKEEFSGSDIYPHNQSDEYWDGYKGEVFVEVDDLFQIKDVQKRAVFATSMMTMNSSNPYTLLTADMHQKGAKQFTSHFIFSTANKRDVTDIGIETPVGFWERQTLCLRMESLDPFQVEIVSPSDKVQVASVKIDGHPVTRPTEEQLVQIAVEAHLWARKMAEPLPPEPPVQRVHVEMRAPRVSFGDKRREDFGGKAEVLPQAIEVDQQIILRISDHWKAIASQIGHPLRAEDVLILREFIPLHFTIRHFYPRDELKQLFKKLVLVTHPDKDHDGVFQTEVFKSIKDDLLLGWKEFWSTDSYQWSSSNVYIQGFLQGLLGRYKLPQSFFTGTDRRGTRQLSKTEQLREFCEMNPDAYRWATEENIRTFLTIAAFSNIIVTLVIIVVAARVLANAIDALISTIFKPNVEDQSGVFRGQYVRKTIFRRNPTKEARPRIVPSVKSQAGDDGFTGIERVLMRNLVFMTIGKRRCYGLGIGRNIVMVPAHCARDLGPNDAVCINSDGTGSMVELDADQVPSIITETPLDEEVAFLVLSGYNHFKTITNHFSDDQIIGGVVCRTRPQLWSTERQTVRSYFKDETNVWSRMDDEVEDNRYKYHQYEAGIVLHNMPNADGYCGLPYYMPRATTKPHVIGIHTAGDQRGKTSYAAAVSRHAVESVIQLWDETFGDELTPQDVTDTLEEKTSIDGPILATPGIRTVGTIDHKYRATVISKSRLVKTPLHPDAIPLRDEQGPISMDWKPTRRPAEPYPYQNSAGEFRNPVSITLDKHATVGGRDNITGPIEESWLKQIPWEDLLPPGFNHNRVRTLSIEEAIVGGFGIDGLDMTKSAGYPYVQEAKKRPEVIFDSQNRLRPEFVKTVEDLEEELVNNVVPMVAIPCTKDELISFEDYEKGKCRLFYAGELRHIVLTKRWLASFVQEMETLPWKTPIAIGINPHSREWGQLFARLQGEKRSNNPIAGDFKGFEYTIPPYMTELIVKFIDIVAPLQLVRERRIRANLIRSLIRSNQIMFQRILSADKGEGSGHPLTAFFNSVANWLFHLFAFLALGYDAKEFKHAVKLSVYGDDSVGGVDPKYPDYNMKHLESFAEQIGMVYTNCTKESIEKPYAQWDQIDYLKRKFVTRNGYVFAPLKLSSVLESVMWENEQSADPQTDRENSWRNVFIELRHYDRSLYSKYHDIFKRWCKATGSSVPIRPWNDAVAEMCDTHVSIVA